MPFANEQKDIFLGAAVRVWASQPRYSIPRQQGGEANAQHGYFEQMRRGCHTASIVHFTSHFFAVFLVAFLVAFLAAFLGLAFLGEAAFLGLAFLGEAAFLGLGVTAFLGEAAALGVAMFGSVWCFDEA
jgi:hypothetical protein